MDLQALRTTISSELDRLRTRHDLLGSFIEHTKLSLRKHRLKMPESIGAGVTIHGFREFREMTRFPHRLVVYRAAWTTRTFGYNNWSAKTSA
jgi:hypothetical protein